MYPLFLSVYHPRQVDRIINKIVIFLLPLCVETSSDIFPGCTFDAASRKLNSIVGL
jgi:hypothetical protein